MKIVEMLPIGSVVRLKEGAKRLMVCGVKQTDMDDDKEYDYIGVMYPEGYIGAEYQFLFNHEDIDEVYFKGYNDEEREEFIEKLSIYYNEKE